MVRECRFANHSFDCVCVCVLLGLWCEWKRENMLLWLLSLRTLPENSSVVNDEMNELMKNREKERGMERKGRESESWNGMEMVLTSTKINASLTAFVRQWFFNCFSLPLPPTTTNGDDDEWTNNDDDDDFICLQFTLWKMKMSVLMFSLPSNKHRAAHICIPSFPQEVAKQEEWTPRIEVSLYVCVCSMHCMMMISKMMMTSINYNNYYSVWQKANSIRKLFRRKYWCSRKIKHEYEAVDDITYCIPLKFHTNAVGTQTHDNFFIYLLC